MMAVCSFLGHRHIYGHDVQLRLQAAVNLWLKKMIL